MGCTNLSSQEGSFPLLKLTSYDVSVCGCATGETEGCQLPETCSGHKLDVYFDSLGLNGIYVFHNEGLILQRDPEVGWWYS